MKRTRWPSGVPMFEYRGRPLVGVDFGADLIGPYVLVLSFDGDLWGIHPAAIHALNDDARAMLAIAKKGGGR